MKLWHDDVRPPPEGWVWARTNDEARTHLLTGEVTEISLDHDMGLGHIPVDQLNEETMFLRGFHEDNGLRMVEWMIENRLVPAKVTIHSWNPSGARNMYLALNAADYMCEYLPYSDPGTLIYDPESETWKKA